MTATVNHTTYMRRALTLARRGWGRTTPNPMVGAVVVQNNEIVGTGFHARAGRPHAEVEALAAAGEQARKATLYVTLEPCSTTGRTPPCTKAIIEAGIRHVIIGCLDTNPAHAGQALKILAQHQIDVTVGVLKEQCQELNEAFFCWTRHGRPFVLLKMAMTLDGKIATPEGDSKWITDTAARRHVQRLRQWADAIMVGGETVRLDNPQLTVRTPRNWWRQPPRLVWTRTPPEEMRTLPLWQEGGTAPEAVAPQSPAEWQKLLIALGARQITALLIEGGGELAAAALQAGIVDKVAFYIAPKILGGRNSRPVVGGAAPSAMAEALPLRRVTHKCIGNDLLITGYLTNVYGLD